MPKFGRCYCHWFLLWLMLNTCFVLWFYDVTGFWPHLIRQRNDQLFTGDFVNLRHGVPLASDKHVYPSLVAMECKHTVPRWLPLDLNVVTFFVDLDAIILIVFQHMLTRTVKIATVTCLMWLSSILTWRNEKQLRYDRNVYREDIKILKKEMRADMAPGQKRNKAPDQGLKLEFVHG